MIGPEVAFDFIPLPGLLRQAAERDPARIAVRDDHHELTYRDLVDAVHRLAHHLIDSGCGRGTRVANCLPRGVDAVVAQAAILTAGAVHVPVDATYPPTLLGRMLTTTAASHVIGHRDAVAACQAAADLTAITLDEPSTAATIEACPTDPPGVGIDPTDGAYVIHTSGSTGQPKGVLVGHRAIANSTMARWHRYPDLVTGFLLVSPMTFDSSMAGVWWTLSQGGTLVLAPTDPVALVARVRQALTDPSVDVSHTLLTPTLYRQVLDGLDRTDTALRHVVVAGEACPDALVRRHHALLPDTELVNEYGPTEAAVWCSSDVLRPDSEVTIGTPIANVEILVLDPAGAQVTSGELCVGGVQLAEGYLGDADLTAEKFVPHPSRPGELVYRTGDRGSLRPDGRVAVSGRLDDQVKIRGHRVDLAGVRARLSDHTGVADLAVALRDRPDASGQVLTAYVVPSVEVGSVERELRDAWAQVVDEVADSAPATGTDFDTSGWTSSLTGRQLPDEDMAEWVHQSALLLREGKPASVLDLGCGSGLPLLRVAPHTDRYVGLDVSGRTLDGLHTAVDNAGLTQVELRLGEASDVTDFGGVGFDLVVSNSVSQYFPSDDYLMRTVRGALDAIRPGGRVVIGDVRDLTLLREFHTAVALARSTEDTAAPVLAARIAKRVEDDAQLLVDPRWFTTLVARLPDVHVEVRPRRGRRRNEMNDFRFDAVVHPADSVSLVEIDTWLDWSSAIVDLKRLGGILGARPDVLGIRRVPNARTAGISAVADLPLSELDGTVADLHRVSAIQELRGVHPEDLFDLAEAQGYHCHLSRSAGYDAGGFDVAFIDREAPRPGITVLPRFDSPAGLPARLTTDPTRHRTTTAVRGTLVPQLRRHAEQVLAAHERPGAYVVLAELPTTRHGKVDLAALPAPKVERPELTTAFVAPRSATETAVASVWAAVLGVDRIGIDDDFVELGGDSLLAATCAVKLTEHLDIALPSGVLFSAPTVRGLARIVEQASPQSPIPKPRSKRTGDSLPLTSAQTAFWFLDHYRRPGGARHPDFALPVHYRISGPLDVDALHRAVDQLVERHEALRTRVLLEASEGSQVVLPPRPDVLAVTRVYAADPDAVLREAARTDATRPLDPAVGRVFTAQLTSASDDEHLLVLRVHHMVADGGSIDVLERELEELYASALAGRAPALPPPPGYREFAHRIDQTFFVDVEWRDNEPYRSALDYWHHQADGAKPIHLFGTDKSSAGQPTGRCGVVLAEHEVAVLLDRARRQGATLFSAVVAALACLRAADSGDADVRLLTLNAARDAPGLDRMIGLLLNPMLIRVDVPPGSSMSTALPETASTVWEALAHGQVPLLALCEEIPDLMALMTESQFVAVESLPPVRGLALPHCRIHRTDPFDDDFLGRSFQLPVELLVVARRCGDSVRLTALHDPATVDGDYARSLLRRLRELLLDPDSPEEVR